MAFRQPVVLAVLFVATALGLSKGAGQGGGTERVLAVATALSQHSVVLLQDVVKISQVKMRAGDRRDMFQLQALSNDLSATQGDFLLATTLLSLHQKMPCAEDRAILKRTFSEAKDLAVANAKTTSAGLRQFSADSSWPETQALVIRFQKLLEYRLKLFEPFRLE